MIPKYLEKSKASSLPFFPLPPLLNFFKGGDTLGYVIACLIVEVLSPSTESFDRGKKFQHYRRISTLREYVLIGAEQMNVEVFRLNDRGIWELYAYIEGEIYLSSVDLWCAIELLYEDVVLEAGGEETAG